MPSVEGFLKIFGPVNMIGDPMSLPAAKRSFSGDSHKSNANRLDYIQLQRLAGQKSSLIFLFPSPI